MRAAGEVPVDTTLGEALNVVERLIVAPRPGVFRVLDAQGTKEGHFVRVGDVIGAVQSLGALASVASPFEGIFAGFLAAEGQRVRPGQPLAWLRPAVVTGH